MAIFIVVDGSVNQRREIASRLAEQLGVAYCESEGDRSRAIAEGKSCVLQGCDGFPADCGCLRILLFEGRVCEHSTGYDLCLDTGVLGVRGSAELLKQFVVQRLVRGRERVRRM